MRSSSIVFPSLSSHCSSDGEMASPQDSFVLSVSFLFLIFPKNSAKPFLRIPSGFRGMRSKGLRQQQNTITISEHFRDNLNLATTATTNQVHVIDIWHYNRL